MAHMSDYTPEPPFPPPTVDLTCKNAGCSQNGVVKQIAEFLAPVCVCGRCHGPLETP